MKLYSNPFSHVDLSVPSLGKAFPFYRKLFSALGSARGLVAPASTADDKSALSSAESPAEAERIAQLIGEGGGKTNAGPHIFPISPGYYAVYFEDHYGSEGRGRRGGGRK